MNKRELASKVAEKTGLTVKKSQESVNAVLETISEALIGGDKLQLIGFGTMEVKERKARKGRNPKTQEEIEIPATKKVTFSAGKQLKEEINK